MILECPVLLSRQQERHRARRILLQNSFLMHLESESISRHGGDPERGEPSPYIGNSPRLGRVTLRLVSCPSSQMTPRERQGLQRWKFANTCALSCSPGGGTGCQRHLAMANVVAVLYRCPSIEEWLKKVWNIYTLEFYSAVKNNDILNFACKWMEIENALLSEVTQTPKKEYGMSSLIR